MNLGISGRLTQATIRSPLTPLFLLASLVVGLIALAVIPREEEPQISVPMVDIRINADGLRGPDAVELVTKPLETIVKSIDGVEHVYSQTEDDRVMVTARFLVGTKADDAILRVHEKMRANLDRIPIGIPEPLIVGRGINDVAVTVLTLSPKPEAAERWNDNDLYELADKLRAELMKVDSIGLTYISGGAAQQIRVEPDPEKLSLFGVTLQQLVAKVKDANRSFLAGSVRDAGGVRSVAAGQTLAGHSRHRTAADLHPRRPPGLCQGRRLGGDRPQHRRASRLERGARRQGRLGAHARGEPGARQARRRQCGGGVARDRAAAGRAEGAADPVGRRGHRHPRLWRDRQRKGQRAAVPSRPRHALDRGADRDRDRLARGAGDARW